MWSTINAYAHLGIVVDRYRGDSGYVSWVVRDADGNWLADHFEPAPPIARVHGREVTRDDVVRDLSVFTCTDALVGTLESAGELDVYVSGTSTWFAHADGKYWRY